jgi:hypothetical protein
LFASLAHFVTSDKIAARHFLLFINILTLIMDIFLAVVSIMYIVLPLRPVPPGTAGHRSDPLRHRHRGRYGNRQHDAAGRPEPVRSLQHLQGPYNGGHFGSLASRRSQQYRTGSHYLRAGLHVVSAQSAHAGMTRLRA